MNPMRGWDSAWEALAARVLGRDVDDVRRRGSAASFVALGGTSLRASEFAALAERRHARAVDLGALLGPRPLAMVATAARPAPPRTGPEPSGPSADPTRPACVGQQAMLPDDGGHGGTAFHLLFSAAIRGPLDPDRLASALAALTRRHVALRTVFEQGPEGLRTRVLDTWEPRLLRQSLRPAPGDVELTVERIHQQLAASSRTLLDPFAQPPVVFVLTRLTEREHVLSLLIHHAVTDGWSVGLLWRDVLDAYDGTLSDRPAADPCQVAAEDGGDTVRAAVERYAVALGDVRPTTLAGDLTRPGIFDHHGVRLAFRLRPAARDACDALAETRGLTRNAVLLTAWATAIGRRTGCTDPVIGVSAAGRTTGPLRDVAGLCATLLPVRCPVEPGRTVRDRLDAVGTRLREALGAGRVPFELLVSRLGAGGDPSRAPLVQIGFAAHDELVPGRLAGADLDLTLYEGHCGGTAFDAILFVQRWEAEPLLALEYATSVLTPGEAAALIEEFEHELAGMAAAVDDPLTPGPGLPGWQAARVAEAGRGATVDGAAGLWQLVEEVCLRRPDAVAVHGEAGRPLTYGWLLRAVERQSAALRAANVGVGDHVAVAVERSAAEIVALLAVVRIGAAYVGVDARSPAAVAAQIRRIARPRAVLGDSEGLARLAEWTGEAVPVTVLDPWAEDPAATGDPEAAAPPDPDRVAYVAFTSGSTGVPKGARIPHRAVVRLARGPGVLLDGAAERFLRLAPLAFDASTLEIFAPLLAGGTVVVYPAGHLVFAELDAFLGEHAITGLWLTAGLFRLLADDRPAMFRGVRQLLTGGDVVPSGQVRAVLRHRTGLTVTNGYGPTENTTFTTVHHVHDAAGAEDPLPIGRPVPGTDVAVVDADGRPLPWGAAGELIAFGDGLAVDYLDAPEETGRAFGTAPDGRRYYRTGDLVRWDGAGRLCYLGRRDHQVKIRGFRVETAAVARLLRGHPEVRDAVVVVKADAHGKDLVAGVVAEATASPDGTDPARLAASLRAFAAERLPAYAVPALWAVVGALPTTANGKTDVARLAEMARGAGDPAAAVPARRERPGATTDPDDDAADVEDAIAGIWADVLGTDFFDYSDRFFDVGGDSLRLASVRAALHRRWPAAEVSMVDLLAHPTVEHLARHLRARLGA